MVVFFIEHSCSCPRGVKKGTSLGTDTIESEVTIHSLATLLGTLIYLIHQSVCVVEFCLDSDSILEKKRQREEVSATLRAF